jgi:hypothetical protein
MTGSNLGALGIFQQAAGPRAMALKMRKCPVGRQPPGALFTNI